jgi:TctA family transporter
MIWILVAIYILILVSELPTLIKNRWYREIAVFTVIFIISVYMGMVQFYHWPFYNPLNTLLPMLSDVGR